MTEEAGVWIPIEAEIEPLAGEMIEASIRGKEIAIYNVEGKLYATENVCSHAYAMLTDGWLDDHIIECPLHGGQFDIRDGRAVKLPAECSIKTYKIRKMEKGIEILIQDN